MSDTPRMSEEQIKRIQFVGDLLQASMAVAEKSGYVSVAGTQWLLCINGEEVARTQGFHAASDAQGIAELLRAVDPMVNELHRARAAEMRLSEFNGRLLDFVEEAEDVGHRPFIAHSLLVEGGRREARALIGDDPCRP